MSTSGQCQVVPRSVLESKVGRILALRDVFTTKTGTWKVINMNVTEDGITEIVTVEKISDATDSS